MIKHKENGEQLVAWEKELPLYEDLKNGIESDLVKEFIEKVKSAISEKIVGVVSCMDDRLAFVNGTLRIAGSMVLLKDYFIRVKNLTPEIAEERIAKIFEELGIDKITTHNDCGAAGKYAQDNELKGDADEITRKEVEEFSKKYGFEHEYIGYIETLHAARSVFVDTTARFNQSKVLEELPKAFVVSACEEIPVQHILDQVNIAISIATGSHGYGEKINNENPFFIFVLGEKGKNKDLDEGIEKIEKNQSGKVRVKYINI